MSTESVMRAAGPSSAHDRKQRQGHNRQRRNKTHTHLTTNCQTQTTEAPIVLSQADAHPVTDTVAFNPKSILPTTKSTKCLDHLQKYSVVCEEDAVSSSEMPFERIDGCTLERNQTRISQSSRSSHDQPPFIAFGVEAHPTRAIFDDICYDFVRSGRWCYNGRRCLRIHPINKEEYLATVMRESVIYSRMRAKRRADLALTPPGTVSKREIDPPRLTSSNANTLSQSNNNAEQRDRTTGLEDVRSVSDSVTSTDDSQISKQYQDPADILAQGSLPRDHFQSQKKRYPRPKSNELCRNWLRGQCDKGFSCRHIHEDLEYDDGDSTSQKDSSGNKTAVVVLRRGPETMIRTLHRHIRVTFASGFRVAELSTGFESFCIAIEGLFDISDSEILEIVNPFGKVRELRRPIDSTSHMTTRVYFEKTSEAFAALIALHRKKFLGVTLDVKPANETNGNRLVFKGNSVRFEWDAPCRTVYMGYSNRRLAEQAIDNARLKPCGDFATVANIHIGIPAVGAVTVRFQYLPLDVDQDQMKIFGPHEGMVTGKPNVNFTMKDVIRGFKHLLKSRRFRITDVDIRGPPYTNGKMTACVTFANARDAQEAAASLHLSPDFMGGMTISAFHVKSISFSLTPFRYQMVAAEIRAFQDRLSKDDNGYWITVSVRNEFVNIRFAGDKVKVLGRLKAEFERILNGEQLYENGKVVWHPFLAEPDGREFLDKLQQDYSGVTIIASSARSSVRLLGDAEKRALVRKRIISFVTERRAKVQYFLPLGPDVANAFAKDQRDGFTALEVQLGEGNVLLDLWQNKLVVSGDQDALTLARDAVFAFRQKRRLIGPLWKGETCPACTAVASSPVKLPCGHSWCRSCLRHYLKSATERELLFPLSCHGINKRCGEPIPLVTAREILSPDDLEALFQSAFSAHVLTHPEELHYCPTPDCPQIYRSTPEGIFMQCPECLSQICTHCHCEAHEGLTCTEVRDGDSLFREWASGNNVKQCPKCKMAIEKAEGCNHMTCSMCRTHICWVCMETFENGLKIYGHMQSEHGGSGI